MIRRLSCVTAFACLGVFTVPASFTAAAQDSMPSLIGSAAPDWPQWRGPRRDGISAETGLMQSWPEGGPRLLWKVSGIGRGFSSPIVVGDRVCITGDQGKDLAISVFTLDGQPQWKTKNGACWQNPYPGARSSCTYDEGKLYHLNAHGRLVCLDAATGDEAWVVNVLERYAAKNITWGISESVVVHGDRVFSTPAGAKGLMVAHDKRTGAPIWASPALDGEQAFQPRIRRRIWRPAWRRLGVTSMDHGTRDQSRRDDLRRRPTVRIEQPRRGAWLGDDRCGDGPTDAGGRLARWFVDLRRGAVLLPERDGHHDSAGTDGCRISNGRYVPAGRRQRRLGSSRALPGPAVPPVS